MTGHWSHQPRTPMGVRTGGEWEPMQHAEAGVTLTLNRPAAPEAQRGQDWRWPRIPKSFEQFNAAERALIMRALPYYDPEAGLTEENLDALRVTVAEATASRFSGYDENHRTISHAARLVAEAHGGVHQMVISAGKHVAARAEQIAGITDEQVGALSARNLAGAEQHLDAARKAVEDHRAQNGGRCTDQDLWGRYQEARRAVNEIRAGQDEDTKAAVTTISQARAQALSELIELGGQMNLHTRSTKKALPIFAQAATKFPASWLEHSGEQGPLLLRYSSDRNHYNPSTEVKSEKTAPVTTRFEVVEGTQHDQGAAYEPVKLIDSYIGPTGIPVETWEFQQYEVVRAHGYMNKVDKRRADWERQRNGHTASGSWKPVGDGEHNRRALRQVVHSEAEYVPMANTGGDKAAGRVHGPEGEHGVSTAAHEITHHLEKTVPGFYELEKKFLDYRTEGQKLKSYMGLKHEYVRDGGFANVYIGKDYNWRSTPSGVERKSTEIGSMGMEMLFHGKDGAFAGTAGCTPDVEMRDFMLGTLVAVDPSREPVRTGIPVYAPPHHTERDHPLFGRRGTTIVDQQRLSNGKVKITLADGRSGEVDPEDIKVG